ncbi:MAG: hypothetical protein GMKNLPBB_03114 [Myxococcota bacterium]|nr:hypothetical protein [Myxococcota bacterium]
MESTSPSPAPSRGLMSRITSGTFHYGLGRVLPQAIGFLLIPLYAALLTPHDYGLVDMHAQCGGVLVLLMRFSLGGSISRFYYDYKEGRELQNYVATIGGFMVINSLLVGGIVLISAPFWLHRILPGFGYFPYFVLAVLASILSVGSEIQRRLMQAREQTAMTAKLNLITALAGIALALFFVAGLRWGAFGMVFAQFLAGLVFYIQAIAYLKHDARGSFEKDRLKGSLAYAAGLFPSHAIAAFLPVANRAILAQTGALESVGLVALANRFVQPVVIASESFASAYPPIYFAVRKQGGAAELDQLRSVERLIWYVTMAAAAGAAMFAPPLIRLLTPETYHSSAPLAPILVAVPVLSMMYTLFGMELFYSKKTWVLPLIAACGAAANWGSTWLLCQRYGAAGAAWGMVAGQSVFSLLAVAAASRLTVVSHDWTAILRTLAVWSAAIAAGLAQPVQNDWLAILVRSGIFIGAVVLLHLSGDDTASRLIQRINGRVFSRK